MTKEEKTINEIIQKYESSSGYKIYNFLLRTKFIQYIFKDNFRKLINHIHEYEKETATKDNKFKIIRLSRTKTWNYLRKFIKHFHNYSAITYSLEEHYEKFLTSLSSRDIRTEFVTIYYKPFRLFIFAVRNNLTHYTVPPFSISINHKIIKMKDVNLFVSKGRFNIDRLAILSDDREARPINGRRNRSDSKFLENDGKRRILRSYISSNYEGLHIDLKEVIEEHHRKFSSHINNIKKRLIELNEAEYNKTKDLHKKIIKIQNKP